MSWTFTSIETEQSLHITMGPEALGTGLLATSTVALPGNGLTLGILRDDPEGVSTTASWPGNTEIFAMSLSSMAFNDEVGDDYQTTPAPDWTTVQAILGSFRPADAASWASYLASAPFDEASPVAQPQDLDLLRTERIEDWLVGPEPETPIPQRDVDFVTVAPGEQFIIGLTMSNRIGATVDISGCAFRSVTWSTVDAIGLLTPAGGIDVDCDPGLQPWADGEQRAQSFEFPGLPDEGPIAAVIQFGDHIEQGIAVVVPGQVGD